MQKRTIWIGMAAAVVAIIGLGWLAVADSSNNNNNVTGYVPGVVPKGCTYLPLNNSNMKIKCVHVEEDAEFAATIDPSVKDVNIFATLGTLPTLFAAFEIFNNPDTISLVWFERTGTINTDKYPANVQLMTETGDYSVEKMNQLLQASFEAVLRYPNARFHVFCDDLRVHFGPLFTTLFGLNEGRWDMTLLSDGTASYTMGALANTDGSGLDAWNSENRIISDRYRKVQFGDVGDVKMTSSLPWRNGMRQFAMRHNVDYRLQYPEFVISGDETVTEILENDVNFKTFIPNDEIFEMEPANRDAMIEAILSTYGLTEDSLRENYFTADNELPFLIVTNTNPIGSIGKSYTEAEFKNMLNQVVDKYSDKYNLVMSSHPADLPTEENGWLPYFESLGFNLLPNRLPMEVAMWIQPEAHMGGFSSTLYMSARADHTEFFFAKDQESLVAPLDLLFDHLFKEAEFIQPVVDDDSKE